VLEVAVFFAEVLAAFFPAGFVAFTDFVEALAVADFEALEGFVLAFAGLVFLEVALFLVRADGLSFTDGMESSSDAEGSVIFLRVAMEISSNK
jgi:hypothetical protein